MIIAAAQTVPLRENIQENLEEHYKLIDRAADHGVELIVFPELSITGYERELAHGQAFTMDDKRLAGLIKLAGMHHMVIVAGAPVSQNGKLFIGSFIIFPDGDISLYTKQFLHGGEEEFFAASFDYNPVISIGEERISLAICADIEDRRHPENACKIKPTVYAASIFYSPGGIDGAHQLLSGYARQYNMAVIMSNFGGESWGMPSGGQSAFWNQRGEKVIMASASGEGLVMVEKINGQWQKKIATPVNSVDNQ